MQLNLPDVVAEVREAFMRYETALVTNDVAALDAAFWRSPETIRFGLHENLYGHAAIAGFRAARRPVDLERTLERTVITAFGRDVATACTEFVKTDSGRRGRQSQTWVRVPEGWRVVAAHVSWLTPASP
jgi:hypothetical protein